MPDAPSPLAGRRILVVEDEYLIAETMAEWLTQAGAEILGPVPTPRLALALIGDHGNGLDAAVLDINLGRGETAYPVADRLAALGVPYVLATGDVRIVGDPAHRQRPRLNKPITRADLLRALGKLL